MDGAVIKRLNNYVYRLIDPRNGETFYVGVGKGKRVLQHVMGKVSQYDDEVFREDEHDPKLARIKDIQWKGSLGAWRQESAVKYPDRR